LTSRSAISQLGQPSKWRISGDLLLTVYNRIADPRVGESLARSLLEEDEEHVAACRRDRTNGGEDYTDGSEETYGAGQAYYMKPGHVPATDEGAEWIEFNPADQSPDQKPAGG
jgi:hypothetical protein